MDEISSVPVIVSEVKTDIERLAEWTKTVVVRTPEERVTVFEATKKVRERKSQVVEFYADMKQKANAAWKAIVSKEKTYTDILDAFKAAADGAILTYDQAEAVKAEAERRRLQAIADEQARKEREKAEAEARRQREIEEAARRKAEEARKAATQADAAERARLLREAEKADLKAATASAKAEIQTENAAAVITPVVQIAPTIDKQKGESVKITWKGRIIDINKIPREYLVVFIGNLPTGNFEAAVNTFARSTKGNVKVDGIDFYPDQSLNIRRSA